MDESREQPGKGYGIDCGQAVIQSKTSEGATPLAKPRTIRIAHTIRMYAECLMLAGEDRFLGAKKCAEKKKDSPQYDGWASYKSDKKVRGRQGFSVARTWVLVVSTALLCLIPVINKYYGFLEGHFARAIFILAIGVLQVCF